VAEMGVIRRDNLKKNKLKIDELDDMAQRRVIVKGYCFEYCRKLLGLGVERYGSLRQLSFALGIAPSVIYRWYNNETSMGEKWVESLESLLQQ
jgi:hypothetical protein